MGTVTAPARRRDPIVEAAALIRQARYLLTNAWSDGELAPHDQVLAHAPTHLGRDALPDGTIAPYEKPMGVLAETAAHALYAADRSLHAALNGSDPRVLGFVGQGLTDALCCLTHARREHEST
ncbi:hypothetical protein [Kitasatospora sp. NPDC004289]